MRFVNPRGVSWVGPALGLGPSVGDAALAVGNGWNELERDVRGRIILGPFASWQSYPWRVSSARDCDAASNAPGMRMLLLARLSHIQHFSAEERRRDAEFL